MTLTWREYQAVYKVLILAVGIALGIAIGGSSSERLAWIIFSISSVSAILAAILLMKAKVEHSSGQP